MLHHVIHPTCHQIGGLFFSQKGLHHDLRNARQAPPPSSKDLLILLYRSDMA